MISSILGWKASHVLQPFAAWRTVCSWHYGKEKGEVLTWDWTSEWADVTAVGPVEPTLSASQVLSGQVTTVVGFSSGSYEKLCSRNNLSLSPW